jgi:N-acetylmuramoyl-L-alanine amidase
LEGKSNLIKIITAVISLAVFLSFNPDSNSLQIKVISGKKYISIYDLVIRFKIENTYDIITGRGKIYHKTHVFVFNTGQSVFLTDGWLMKSGYPVIKNNGEVLIPYDIAVNIISVFYPELEMRFSENSIDFGIILKKEPEKTVITKISQERITFIVIDAGHGGKDPGAVGKGGIKEKNITLKTAKSLEKKLRKLMPDMNIYLTRNSDRFIELSGRTEFANKLLKKNENGIFLSIHVNATLSKKISGLETYFLSQNPSNEDARNTAALENNVVVLEEQGSGKKYEDVDYIEAMMMTTQILKESSILADSVQKGMVKKVKIFKSRGVKKADFFVLRGVLMPAILVEIGFISNPNEAVQIQKENQQNKISDGIAEGILNFIEKYNRLISN